MSGTPVQIALEDVNHRFAFHAATTDEKRFAHASARAACARAAADLVVLCPPGRELSTAITKLEEAMFWANAALAREPKPAPSPQLPLDTPLSTGGPSTGRITVCTVDHYCETGGCNGRPR